MKINSLKVALCLLISIYFTNIFAQNITLAEAQQVAKNFYYERVNQFYNIDYKTIDFLSPLVVQDNDEAIFYVFNLKANKGFVIVSANNNVIPVFGYAFEGEYNEVDQPENIKEWIGSYKRQIAYAKSYNLKSDTKILQEWERLLTTNKANLKTFKGSKAILPLLTTKWNQGINYNGMCPVDLAGPNDRCYAGCVATAMGQLMYYHRFPKQGLGSYSYNHPVYGIQSADFANTTYNWNGMQNAITDPPNNSIAELLYHLGVSVDMNYGPNGSGMWNHKAAYSLRTYFKYVPETQYLFRDSTTLNWDSILIANLDARKPLYYAGWTSDLADSSGHAFVCDGYQGSNYYHFNWGWGGSSDGYFYTNALNPSGLDFNYHQEMIHDIYPDTLNYSYPDYCNGLTEVNFNAGTIQDGSSIKNYKDSLQCEWLIKPVCGVNVLLKFDQFDLAANDTVFIYKGLNGNSTPLSVFTAANQPVVSTASNPTITVSDTSAMFIRFVTGDSLNASGWLASYYTEYCNSNKIITDSIGSFGDGSGNCDYDNSTFCKWTIQPANAQHINLNFTEFNLAANNVSDYVQVYKNSTTTANLIGKYEHINLPPQSISIDAGVAVIRFISNTTETSGGWKLNYVASSTSAINNVEEEGRFTIFPNPINSNSVLTYQVKNNEPVQISISDLAGRTISTFVQKMPLIGENSLILKSITGELQGGIYLIKISSNSFSKTLQFVNL